MSPPADLPEIRALDDATIRQIAAGEVVERPASVVKELVENSIDAGADAITVAVRGGGIDRIRVTDDGHGMAEAGLRQAVGRHTTSKLRSADDLAGGIDTLGFRGEALHTIGAVSRLSISSRPADGRGHELTMVDGEIDRVEPAGCPPGTTVVVEELFANTPARRAFLGTPATEFDHVNRVGTHYALAHPDVAVTLRHDDRDVFQTAGRGDLAGAVMAVYGRDVATAMQPVAATFDDGPVTEIEGLVSAPETTRSRARYLSTFVNGRYVRANPIRSGILSAYEGQLAPDRYPFAVLFCTVDPASVDVNVHPRKLEVRFDDAALVTSRVETAVREAIRSGDAVRSSAPRGRSQPPETPVAPASDRTETVVAADARREPRRRQAPRQASTRSSTDGSDEADRRFRAPGQQRTVGGDEPTPTLESLPACHILGQYDETFIIATSDDGILLIDQHAADERINYERLRNRVADGLDTQSLMEPIDVPVTADERAAFPALLAGLEAIGFRAEPTDHGTIRVSGVPTVIDTSIAPERIRDAIASAVTGADPGAAVDDVADAMLADMACYPSVTAHTRLSSGSMVDLLETLDECEDPYACPHGRPVVIRIDHDELEDRFERDYPGHAGRRPTDET